MNTISVKNPIELLRERRVTECFSIINRGKLWYDCLTVEQLAELKSWYWKWLNVTETLVVPDKPKWLSDKLEEEEVLL
jgi:hypothetical protein